MVQKCRGRATCRHWSRCLNVWDLANGDVWDAGHSLVPQGGWRPATGFEPKLRTLRAFKGKAQEVSYDITIYPDDMGWKVSSFYWTCGLGMCFSNSQAM